MTQGYHIVPFKAQKYAFFLFYETQTFFKGHTGHKFGAHGAHRGTRLPFGVPLCPQNMATLKQRPKEKRLFDQKMQIFGKNTSK